MEVGAANTASDTVNIIWAVEATDQFEAAATADVAIVQGAALRPMLLLTQPI